MSRQPQLPGPVARVDGSSPVAAGYPDSCYFATARGIRHRPALAGHATADACVIGGGYTGLSAALHLATRGCSVVLLEAGRIGSGAAGRNGGQVGSGQRLGQDELEAQFGRTMARQLWGLAEEAKACVREHIERHHIDCDLRAGQLVVAAKRVHAAELRERAARLAGHYGYADARYVPPAELQTMLGSTRYHGGLLDGGAFHLHPLNYALGLAAAADAAGVRIHENSAALAHDDGDPLTVRTAGGTVTARCLVLGGDADFAALEPRLASRVLPVNNFMIATAPLDVARARALIRDDVCVHDTRFVVNYFRLSADRRLLFGGGETYGSGFPRDIAAFMRPRLLAVFPQLANLPIDYAWGGTLGITRTRLPQLGRLGANRFFAQGYSGHGIGTATLAGRLIAEAAVGQAGRFDVFARLPAPRWPGGALLRQPLLTLGMLWYALRDRL